MDDNGRVLVVGAHPDDAEFACGGVLSLLHGKGYQIHIATMSPGDCGTTEYSAVEIARIRRSEATESAAILDGKYYCLEERDMAIDYNTAARRKVVSLIREVDPFLVITNPLVDYLADHEITGRLVRDACFLASVPNFAGASTQAATSGIPHLYYGAPAGGVDNLGNPVPVQFVIDVSDDIETKKQMLSCHRSQREWLMKHHGMDEYINSMLEACAKWGQHIGAEYGEAFNQHLGPPYPEDNKLQEELGAS